MSLATAGHCQTASASNVSAPAPFTQHVTNKNIKNPYQVCACLHAKPKNPPQRDFLVGIEGVGSFLTTNAAVVEAMATTALAVVTILLAIIAIRQHSTIRTQLRAYLYIDDAILIRDSGKHPKVGYVVKNGGFTPAHKVTTLDRVELVKWEPAQIPVPSERDYLGSIGPNGDIVECDAEVPDNITIQSTSGKDKAIFLVGKIIYLDAFKKERTTEFCFYWTGPVSVGDNRMMSFDEGNDSD